MSKKIVGQDYIPEDRLKLYKEWIAILKVKNGYVLSKNRKQAQIR